MNSLDRSLVTSAGYKHGSEFVVEESPADHLVLGSAHHRAHATVQSGPAGGWRVRLSGGPPRAELARITGIRRDGRDAFAAANDQKLWVLLSRAARLARTLPDLPRRRYEQAVADELAVVAEGPSATEVERLVRQRVGQDIYRASLFDYWGGACAVTGITIPELLRASHAKPWADCDSDAERLDVFNGFLLAAHLDALFDRHLLTFDAQGRALFSLRLTPETRAHLGLAGEVRLRSISPEHEVYLAGHRKAFASNEGHLQAPFEYMPSPKIPRFSPLPKEMHSGLIVATLWQNNFGHENRDAFARETCAVLGRVGNLLLTDERGAPLPRGIFENDPPARRMASYVARLERPENANTLAKRLQAEWIGPNQGASNRGYDLGNGHRLRMNFVKATQVWREGVYEVAFRELAVLTEQGGEVSQPPRNQTFGYEIEKVVAYLRERLQRPV